MLLTHINSSRAILGVFGGKLNTAMVEADTAKLEEYYKDFGYLDVHVSRELHWNDDGVTAALIFHVQEGLRYQMKDKPHVSGVHSFPPEQLEQLTSVKRRPVLQPERTWIRTSPASRIISAPPAAKPASR